MKVSAQAEHGVIPSPSVVEEEVCYQYRLEVIDRVPDLVERFYAIIVKRRLKHPDVIALSETARSEFFSPSGMAKGRAFHSAAIPCQVCRATLRLVRCLSA